MGSIFDEVLTVKKKVPNFTSFDLTNLRFTNLI